MVTFSPKPPWLRVLAPGGERYHALRNTLRGLGLHTVCEEAHCPNVGECWRAGTATVMLLGDVCTRGCRFCAVTSGHPAPPDAGEPDRVAAAIEEIGLRYVVLTMVNRDDLPDGGAGHVARTVTALRARRPSVLIEVLVGDMAGREADIDTIVDARPDVFAHNVEVVRELTRKVRDVRCDYDRSLEVLRHAKERAPARLTKSSIMVGLGERDEQVEQTLIDLRSVDVDIVTLGQYLRPSAKHQEVVRYVPPETFSAYEHRAQQLGFRHICSGPLVRSSYRAAEVFVQSVLRPNESRGES